ncbi:uncharacterized protein FIBRA_07534 [Fibroporia radiculosa]|uniref:JmjC domain-containing protein n=1 Tax=Fibroporia radiculosa TaxID=599839 RepID=J4GV60_9APHY|nr:uncharacterized protein FIBRA_07534 [Fibroporia radiculosa]CCM05320.1 predicted protein [Fibroporia radiculosa]
MVDFLFQENQELSSFDCATAGDATRRAVLIGPHLVSSWPVFDTWVLPRASPKAESQIDWDLLSNTYGDLSVTAADCSTREFSDQKRSTMLFRDVVALWKAGGGSSLYIKDWHLARSSPIPFYTTPDIFRDDWMNAYYSACTQDDFRFVYAGAAGTFTPLHRDVYTSYSWSTNICGRKRWWLFPPEQTRWLMKKGREEHGETAYDVRTADPHEFPELGRANPIIVEQEEGETIFVPSGWYHQVENLTVCISINHNWCNAVNLPSLYESMCTKVVEVERALDDVRELLSRDKDNAWELEWVRIVQDVVEKDAGWNWITFWKMVLHALHIHHSELCPGTPEQPALWKLAPTHLMPGRKFIEERIHRCYTDFMQRDRREIEVHGLRDVLLAVGGQLGAVTS